MPNHVHGIIHINKSNHTATNTGKRSHDTPGFCGYAGDMAYKTYQSEQQTQPRNKFGPQSQNLGSILRGFKIGVKKELKYIHPEFGWQGRFHDHIIRSEEEYHRITMYIRNNPANWKDDSFNKQ